MKKKNQFKVCNWCLLALTVIALASGIVLECLHGEPWLGISCEVFTWLHIIACVCFMVLTLWHLWLHWRKVSEWWQRIVSHHSPGFKLTALFFLLTFLTGLVCIPLWIRCGHVGIGGWHGKLGFIAIILLLPHIKRHWYWYAGKRKPEKLHHPTNALLRMRKSHQGKHPLRERREKN